jgi:predicted metalloenzyme YecM
MNFSETGGKTDYVYFGEATDATDGPPADAYDVPKSPPPIPPYLRAWFNDNLPSPYDVLLKDYRHYPGIHKVWNLSIQWVPTDYVSPTTATMTWSTSKINMSEYDKVMLTNGTGVVLVPNMSTSNSYTYSNPAMVPKTFKINCTVDKKPPQIIDHSPATGETGDSYTFNTSVFDDLTPSSSLIVKVNWSHGSLSGNDTMTSMNGNYFVKTITLSDYSTNPLTYHFYAKDTAKVPNVNYTTQYAVIVTDDESPNIVDGTVGPAYTGDSFTFDATVTDNIAVSTVYVEYWYGSWTHTNFSMPWISDNLYQKTITVLSNNTQILYYIISANDAKPNWANTGTKNVGNVIDNDAPAITDGTAGPAYTGDSFTFSATVTDNIAVSTVYVEYWYGTWTHSNVTMPWVSGSLYQKTITVLSNTTLNLNYIVSAKDARPNWANTGAKFVAVIDNDPPVITDGTVGPAYTGDSFTFSATVTDNVGLSTVYVEYWYGAWTHSNVTMPWVSGSLYQRAITVLSNNTQVLYYIISAKDARPNWVNTGIKNVGNIIDNDAPAITDGTTGPAYTGDSFTFSATVTDNIAVSTVYVEYWYGAWTHTNVSMPWVSGSLYQKTITVLSNTTLNLNYIISAKDARPNWANTGQKNVNVVDNDAPAITDGTTGPAYTGDSFTFSATVTDNIAVSTVYVEYWYGTWTHTNVTMPWISGDLYQKTITVLSNNTQILYYIISAKDAKPNWINTGTKNVGNVIDNKAPVITDGTSGPVYTGDPFTFSATVTDNIGVSTVYVEYWYGTWTHTNVTMLWISGDLYQKTITVLSNNTQILYYIISAKDAKPNWANTGTKNVGNVIDNDPPQIINIGANPNYQIINGRVNITADITDNINLLEKKVRISGPAGYTPVNISMTHDGGNTYYYNSTYTITGIYNYSIWAKDNSNNRAISTIYQFTIFTKLQITTLLTGWNFVSLPCNQSVSKIQLIVKYSGTEYYWSKAVTNGYVLTFVYEWNRTTQAYGTVEGLAPGQGYWMYAYFGCELWVTNLSAIVTDTYITPLKTKWNIVGVPAGVSLNETALIVRYDNVDYNWTQATTNNNPTGGPLILKFIYGWDRVTSQGYFISTTLDAGYCYWIYAYQQCVLKRTP